MELIIFDFEVQKILDALRKATDIVSQSGDEDVAEVLGNLGYEIEIVGEENGLIAKYQFCVE